MKLDYAYERDGQHIIGWFVLYPQHVMQADSIPELEAHLRGVWEMIRSGEIDGAQSSVEHGQLDVA